MTLCSQAYNKRFQSGLFAFLMFYPTLCFSKSHDIRYSISQTDCVKVFKNSSLKN